MNKQPNQLTLIEALEALKQKRLSLDELYTAIEKATKQSQPFNIYLTINKQARKDAQKAEGQKLAGVPIAVKDNFCTASLRTTASSTVLDKFVPTFDATVIKKLRAAGGVVYGKTNLDAWAHGSSTETSQYERTLNPRNADYLPGGSSGGSAAAVAADACLAALGTETAGSIRQPAAWCGVVGLKPTYGRVSRSGVVAMASSTDSPGVLAKTTADAATILNQIAGPDPYDSTCRPTPAPDFTKALKKPVKNLKLGILYQDLAELKETYQLLEPALHKFQELGVKLEPASALDPHLAISVYTIVQRGEVCSNLARYQHVRYSGPRSLFGDEAKRRILLGTYTLSKGYADKYYLTAQKVRTLFSQDFSRLFQKYDALISPTSPSFAKKIGASEGEAMFGELEDMLMEPSSITGLPGINLPAYRDPKTNLFLGINLVAPMWQEETVIALASAFESVSEWNTWQTK